MTDSLVGHFLLYLLILPYYFIYYNIIKYIIMKTFKTKLVKWDDKRDF